MKLPSRLLAPLLACTIVVGAVSSPAYGRAKPKPKPQAKTIAPTTTTARPAKDGSEAAPGGFCDAWAAVRDIRSSGLSGIRSIRAQADRYKALVAVSPADVRPSAQIMADYFATTLEIADKPVGSEKAAARLEFLIPQIGDAIAAVTRKAVRACPRSLVVPSTIGASGTDATGSTTTTSTAPPPKVPVKK